jgi:hypothetical protein
MQVVALRESVIDQRRTDSDGRWRRRGDHTARADQAGKEAKLHGKKNEWAIEDDIRRTTITLQGFLLLSPAERRKRIEKRLTEKGLEKDELPNARAFRRFWERRAKDLRTAINGGPRW